jgi:hypothetical protein
MAAPMDSDFYSSSLEIASIFKESAIILAFLL